MEVDSSQFEIPQRKRNGRLRRGVHLLPGILTTINLGAGCYAILCTFLGNTDNFDRAAMAIGLAILADSLDGRMARMIGSTSEFGKQYDSLADMVSFGIAPGMLAYVWGVRGMLGSDLEIVQHVTQLGQAIVFAYVVCCAWRLARFNIQGMAPEKGSRYFVGMPAPGAAGMVAATVHALKFPLEGWRGTLVWLVLVAGLAVLMSSTIRFYSFKDIGWTKRQPSLLVVAIGLLVWSMVKYSEQVLLIIASSYTLSGLALWLVRTLRHRFSPRTASGTV